MELYDKHLLLSYIATIYTFKYVKFLSFKSTGKNSVLHWCSHACIVCMQTNSHQSICYMQENSHNSLWYIEENNHHGIGPPPWLRVVLLWPVQRHIFFIHLGPQLPLEIFYFVSMHSCIIIFCHCGIHPMSPSGNIWILIIKTNTFFKNLE